MGYSAYSYTVYGKIVNKSDITELYQVRGCKHNVDTSSKFCPECGKPMFKIEEREKGLFDEDNKPGTIGKYYSDYASDTFIVGFCLAHTSYNSDVFMPVQPVTDKMKQDLIDFFTENEIEYQESDFKVYTYTYHSY